MNYHKQLNGVKLINMKLSEIIENSLLGKRCKCLCYIENLDGTPYGTNAECEIEIDHVETEEIDFEPDWKLVSGRIIGGPYHGLIVCADLTYDTEIYSVTSIT